LGFGKSRTRAVRNRATRGSSCRAREHERGVALVEFTLIMPFLLILVVGIIDFGLMFGDVIGVRGGVGDGGRQAAVGKFGSDGSCWLDPEYNVTGSAQMLMCLVKSRDSTPDDRTRVRVMVGEVGCEQGPGACYAVGQPVTICEQYQMKSIAGKMPTLTTPVDGKVFTTRSVVRIETLSGFGLQTAWEKPLKSSWSCSAPAP
jgi:TadE-like protein